MDEQMLRHDDGSEPDMREFASTLASQMQENPNMAYDFSNQSEPVQSSAPTGYLGANVKEALFVSLIVFLLSNPMVTTQLTNYGPKLIVGTSGSLSLVGILILSILCGSVYYVGKMFLE